MDLIPASPGLPNCDICNLPFSFLCAGRLNHVEPTWSVCLIAEKTRSARRRSWRQKSCPDHSRVNKLILESSRLMRAAPLYAGVPRPTQRSVTSAGRPLA